MNLVPASTLPIESLAALFTASYDGYLIPIRVDAATLEGMLEAWDIDLAKSRVALGTGSLSVSRCSPCVTTEAGSVAWASSPTPGAVDSGAR